MPPRQQSPEVIRPKYDRSVCRNGSAGNFREQRSHPANAWVTKGQKSSRRLHHSNRLKGPHLRRNGRPPTVIDMTGLCAILALLPTKLPTFPTVEVRRLRRKKDYRALIGFWPAVA